jgi:ubiquinone/menaquinone biosynthesis C-methylase UbiE
LDIAAGTGSVSRALTEIGFKNITLCDISAPMLEVACKKLSPILGYRPRTLVMPMQALEAPEGAAMFDVAICRQAINYSSSTDQLCLVFSHIHRVLRPGGKLVFNAPNFSEERRAEYTSKFVHQYSAATGETVRIRESNALFTPGRLLHHVQHCTVTKVDGEKVSRSVVFDLNSFTLFTAAEFVQALRSAGFTAIETFGKHFVTPCPPDSRSLYIVAES